MLIVRSWLLNILLILLKAAVAFAIRDLTSWLLSQFSLMMVPKYDDWVTRSIGWLFMVMFAFAMLLLLIAINFVFLLLISRPYLALTAAILFTRDWSPSRLSENTMVSSAYLMLFSLSPFRGIPSSTSSSASLKICSEYMLNNSGERMQP